MRRYLWILGTAGCASVLGIDLDGLHPPAAHIEDAGVEDAADDSAEPAPDASDGGSDASVNLLVNGDFELGGCAGWQAWYSTVKLSSVARTGTGACEVCVTNGGGLKQWIGIGDAGVGQRFYGEFWTRAVPDASPLSWIGLELHVIGPDGGTIAVGLVSGAPGAANWEPRSSLVSLADGGRQLLFYVKAAVGTSGCFVVDDAKIVRQ